MNDSPPLLRPTPRQPSELTPDSLSAESSVAATPVQTPSDVSPTNSERPAVKPATRNGSVFNLTSSTLSGIYARSGDESLREGSATPGGAGAQTPARRASLERKASMVVRTGPRPKGSPRGPSLILSFRGYVLRLVPRMTLLFGVGVAYGILITQLHMSQRVAPVIVENIHRASWRHLALWGMAGIFLGGLLPWIDMLWEQAFGGKEGTWKREEKPDSATSETADSNNDKGPPSRREYGLDADWNPAVRSIGAFIGIAFAIVSTTRSLVHTRLQAVMANVAPSVNSLGNPPCKFHLLLPWSTLFFGISLIAPNLVSFFLRSSASAALSYFSG